MKVQTSEVTVSFPIPGVKEPKKVTAPVTYNEYETAEDVLAALSSAEGVSQILRDLNYSSNMQARAEVRAEIKAKFEGPGKAVAKVIRNFVDAMAAMGVKLSESDALEQMKSMPKFAAALAEAEKSAPVIPAEVEEAD